MKTVLGYLTFINEGNKKRRKENFLKSIESLKKIKSKNNLDIVNFDNNSCDEAREVLEKSGIFNKKYFFNNNFFDQSVLYGTYYYAKKNNYKFMIYAYDDILFLDKEFIGDCEKFLEDNSDVDCVRLCEYKKDNKNYDSKYTSKQINPDAINHWVCHKNNKKITWEETRIVGHNIFHVNDWHYTSRCTMFKVESFEKIILGQQELPVLQYFEKHAYDVCKDIKIINLKTGILEGGAFRTLAQHTTANSERLVLGNNFLKKIFVKVSDIEDNIKL